MRRIIKHNESRLKTHPRWLGFFLSACFAALAFSTIPCRAEKSMQELLDDLKAAKGMRKLIIIEQLKTFHDTAAVNVLFDVIDPRDSNEVSTAIIRVLESYGKSAEASAIEALKQTTETNKQLICIEVLCKIKSVAAVEPFLNIMVQKPQPQVAASIKECMLVLGDQCLPALTAALKNETLRPQVEVFLYNTISLQALHDELEKSGHPLTAQEANTYAQLDEQKKAEILITRLKSVVLGTHETALKEKASPDSVTAAKAFLIDQFTVHPNPFFWAAALLVLLLFVFIIKQLMVPLILPDRKLTNLIDKIERLIARKNWREALKLADSFKPGSVPAAQAEEIRRNLKAKIYRVKAEEELEKGNFDAALREYELYCRITGKEDSVFQELVRNRKIESLAHEGWQEYAQRSLVGSRQIFISLLKEDPNIWQAYYALGLIDIEENLFADAARQLETAMSKCKNAPPDLVIFLAIISDRIGEYAQCLSLLSSLTAKNESQLAWYFFGKFATNRDETIDKGTECLQKLLVNLSTLPLWGANVFIAPLEEEFGFTNRIIEEEVNHLAGAVHWALGQAYAKTEGEADKSEAELAKARSLGYPKKST